MCILKTLAVCTQLPCSLNTMAKLVCVCLHDTKIEDVRGSENIWSLKRKLRPEERVQTDDGIHNVILPLLPPASVTGITISSLQSAANSF